MAHDDLDLSIDARRSLGRLGTAGSVIATLGVLCILSYCIALFRVMLLIVDHDPYVWWFTMPFGWTILLAGSFLFIVGAALMLGDWKRREPEPPAIPAKVKVKATTAYDAAHPGLEHHVEA